MFKVDKEDVGKRLDLFLSKHNNDFSRSLVKKNIENDKVLINGDIEYKANYKVQMGDEIIFQIEPLEDESNVIPQKIDLEIIYEDRNLLVINKPSGMVVHPGSGHSKNTLVNALKYYYKDLDKFEDKTRSGLIHRIDKDTSGLILVAKNNEALNYYTKQFSKRLVSKQYLAVVYGQLDRQFAMKKKIVVQNHLARSSWDRKKYTVVEHGGKFAHTEFSIVLSQNNLHLIEADIKTGRTHQIRVHLNHLGSPILGDIKYGKRKHKRLMLHAWRLGIDLMNGDKKQFEAPIPDEFRNIFHNV